MRNDDKLQPDAINAVATTENALGGSADSVKVASAWKRHFHRSTETLRDVANAAANYKGKRTESEPYEELLYRGLLLNDIASAQAGIGDDDGVQATLAHLRQLRVAELPDGGRVPVKIGEAIVASVVPQARSGIALNIKDYLAVIDRVEFPVDGEHQKAALLRQMATAYADAGDMPSAGTAIAELKSYSHGVIDPVHRIESLHELAIAQIAHHLRSSLNGGSEAVRSKRPERIGTR